MVGNYLTWYDDHTPYSGAAYVVSGASLDGLVEVFFADWTVEGTSYYEYVGWSVAGIGDEDGDGFADVLVGSINENSYAYQAGAGYVFRGPLSGSDGVGDADATFYGGDEHAYVGFSSASGDVTGDGWADIVMGAPGLDGTSEYAGAAYVLPGGGY